MPSANEEHHEDTELNDQNPLLWYVGNPNHDDVFD